MVKRAWLYLTRKYIRSILLLLLLFAVSFSVIVGLCVWNNINEVTQEVEHTFGTGFRLKVPSHIRNNPQYCKSVTAPDGSKTLAYAGPKMGDELINAVCQLNGITQYDAELDAYVVFESGKLFPGLHTWAYEHTDQIAHEEGYSLQEDEMWTRAAMTYGHTDTSLSDYFRTGSFTLSAGRHINQSDQWTVLISDKLAEINGLQVGDNITLSLRNGLGGFADPLGISGEMKQLEVVGIFHVNGLQPETTWVAEIDSTYNYLITDMTTSLYFTRIAKEKQYANYHPDILYENLTFFVDDPKRLESVMAEVKALDTIDVSQLDFFTDDTMYKSTVAPLTSIRNLIAGMAAVIAAGCAVVLCIVFTMWVRSRKQEIAIYLSMGFGKIAILGQFVLEAAMIAVLAGVLSFATCQRVPELVGNRLLTSAIEDAQPQEREITREEIHQAVTTGAIDQLYHYESGDYAGPEHINFTFRPVDFLLLLLVELFIIVGTVCKSGAFIFKMQPRQILSEFR